jgi:hypothetical protein
LCLRMQMEVLLTVNIPEFGHKAPHPRHKFHFEQA